MKEAMLDRAKQVIDEALRGYLDEVPFVKIAVFPKLGEDDEEFLWVNAVYDGGLGTIDPRRSVRVIGHIRSRLEEVDVEAFPVISYIAKSDFTEKELAAL